MKTATGVLPSSRPPLARMQHIHARLAAGRKVTRAALATELETSPRTIQRDLDHLRDTFGLPIAYDAAGHSFRYLHAVEDAPFGLPPVSAPTHAPGVAIHNQPTGGLHLPLEDEPQGHLDVICQRHSLRPEHVLAAIVGESLADAVCNSRILDGIVRAARVLAVQGAEEAAA